MKKLVLILILFVLLFNNVRSEVVTEGSVIGISATNSSTTSLDIKDVIKANLLRPYGTDEFEIDVTKLPSVNDNPYLLTQVTPKIITMTPNKLDIAGKGIKFINGNALLMPLTKYILAKNLRIYVDGDRLKIEDGKLSFKTTKVTIKDGIVYLGDNEIPVRVMPNRILSHFLNGFKEENFKKMSIESNNEKIEYIYTFSRPAKILYLFDTNVDVSVIVDGQTGKYSINKPLWTIFTTEENAGIKEYNFTEDAAF